MAPRNAIPNLAGKVICDGQITLHETLGQGSFGRVFRGETADKTSFAVKLMAQHTPGSPRALAQAKEQALHLDMGEHPNIVTLHAAASDSDFVYIVMENCPGGDLYRHMTKKSFIGDTDGVKNIFGQVMDAVHYCHEQGVYHRDLKPDNILMSKDGAHAYLSDFGLSTTSTSSMHTVGTKHYESPECLQASSLHRSYEHAPNDVWALGVILCSMISSCRPWDAADDTDPYFATFRQDPRWLYDTLPISEEAFKLLCDIFTLDPRFRVTLPELKERVAGMKTFFRDMEEDGLAPVVAIVVDVVLMRDMSDLEEVAIPFNWDYVRRKPKWRERVGAKLGNLFARLR